MDLNQLFKLCTANKIYDKRTAITGGKIRSYVVNPYATYCEFFVSPDLKDEISDFGRKLINWGNEIEKKYVETIQPGLSRETYFFNENGVKNSVQDCLNGKEFIYNPPLFYLSDDLAGKADLLRKDNSHLSNFGNHHYIVEEIKFSKDFDKYDKSHYLYQGVFYNYLLGLIQGYTPEKFYMVDRFGNRNEFDYKKYETELFTVLQGINDIKNGVLKPIPKYNKCEKAYWNNYTNQKAIEDSNLSLIVNFHHSAKTKAENNGITKISDFAKLTESDVSNLFSKPKPNRDRFLLANAQAINENTNKILNNLTSEFTDYSTYLFLDIEDSGWIHPNISHFVFLIGVTVFDGKESFFKSFVAFRENEESIIADEYFDFVNSFDNPIIFYWSPKEKSEFDKFFKLRYTGDKHTFSDFQNVSVDMLPLVKSTVAFPIYRYSVKDVAKNLGFKWRQEDVDALESMVLFWNLYESGCTDKNDERIKKIIDYNEDDCNSMLHIFNWMKQNIT